MKSTITLLFVVCGTIITSLMAQVPLTDPTNSENWGLVENVSDEFDGTTLDTDKWYVKGSYKVNGVINYKDPSSPIGNSWAGRAPSQFSSDNYRLEDGKLKLMTKWDPTFPFFNQKNGDYYYGGSKTSADGSHPITTAALIQQEPLLYGYLEIKCKATDAEISSAFWGTGNNIEIDIFEFFGDHRQSNKLWKDRELWWSIHDWKYSTNNTVFTEKNLDLGFRVAAVYHVYGFDWSEDGIKYYVDGELFRSATKDEIDSWVEDHRGTNGNAYLTKFPAGYGGWEGTKDKAIHIWLDQECFPWHGLPTSKADLTLNGTVAQKAGGYMDYEIEYVRVWKRGTGNGSTSVEEDAVVAPQVYPNPTNGQVTVEGATIAQVAIYNLNGQLLRSYDKSTDVLQFSVADLQSGAYILSLQAKDGSKTSELLQVQ